MSLRRPRKILNIKPSIYESAEAIHTNKKYWKHVFDVIDERRREPISEHELRVLSEALPASLFQNVCGILNINLPKRVLDIDIKTEDSQRRIKHAFLSKRKTFSIDRELNSDTDVEICRSLQSYCKTKLSDINLEGFLPVLLVRSTHLIWELAVFISAICFVSLTFASTIPPRPPNLFGPNGPTYFTFTLEDDGGNIHQEFLRKPIREQVTWATRYLQPEQEHEKTLVKKADDLTNRIANRFCDYMKDLGGDQQSQLFTPKTIKELFQIEFDTHAARSLKVVPKELPSINERIANVTGNKEKSRYAALDREISKDVKAERRADYVKCFQRSIPRRDQWRSPFNHTKNQWKSARHVPKDLVSLKAVWEGITNLRSVKEYCRWMIEHPEYRRAPYLSSLGMFDQAVLDARLTVELKDTNIDTPAPIEQIRKRLSNIIEPNRK